MRPILLFIASFGLGLTLTAQVPDRNLAAHKLPTSYFIDNRPDPVSGQQLVENPEVSAVLMTSRGRVLFTDQGMSLPVTKSGAKFITQESTTNGKAKTAPRLGFSHKFAPKNAKAARLKGASKARANFLQGKREHWRTELPMYHQLEYDQVWDGVSLAFETSMDRLTLRIVVNPKGKLDQVALNSGTEKLKISAGKLAAMGGQQGFSLSTPVAYQEIGGMRVPVEMAFQIQNQGQFGLKAGAYQGDAALTIETELELSTILAGQSGVVFYNGNDVAIDPQGNAYLVGNTLGTDLTLADVFVAKFNSDGSDLEYLSFIAGPEYYEGLDIALDSSGYAYLSGLASEGFPVTEGAFDTVPGHNKAFICKLNGDGSELLYATYLGGSGVTRIEDLAIDGQGNAYVTGKTYSNNFPVTPGAFDETFNGSADGFAAKLDSTGSSLLYATYIGGAGIDGASALALDASGNCYIVGTTDNDGFPSARPSSPTKGSAEQGFALKLNPDGSSLEYVTLFPTSSCHAVLCNGLGEIFVSGETSSVFPVTPDALDDSYNGGTRDGFLAKLDATGSLTYGTYLGGSTYEVLTDMAFGPDMSLFLCGFTNSSDFPTTPGALQTTNVLDDGFVVKLNPSATSWAYSSLLGGTQDDRAKGITVDSLGYAYVIGESDSVDFPTTPGAYEENHSYPGAFVSKWNLDGTALVYASCFPGSGMDVAQVAALDGNGNLFVGGATQSEDFPNTPGSYQTHLSLGFDAYVLKMNPSTQELIYATYIGGGARDWATGMVSDADGNIFLAGYTESADFPTSINAWDSSNSAMDGFVLKLNAQGNDLIYSTYLGGSYNDMINSLDVDAMGQAYVFGDTSSADFPTTPGAYDTVFSNRAPFITKLSADGSSLIYATFFGDEASARSSGIRLDSQGQACIIGRALEGLPTTPGVVQTDHHGDNDLFIAKLDSSGSSLIFSTYLGGSQSDSGKSLVLDGDDNIYAVGRTYSSDFPTTPGVVDEVYNGDMDMVVVKLNASASALSYATYLGGDGTDSAVGLSLDPSGALLLTGSSSSLNYPTTPGSQAFGGMTDAVITRLTPDGDSLDYSSYFGGNAWDDGAAVVCDDHGGSVVGTTFSPNFPTTSGAMDETYHNAGDGFVLRFNFYCSPLAMFVPSLVAQSLDPVELNAEVSCAGLEGELQWTDLNSGQPFEWGANPILLDPLLTATRDYEIRLSDRIHGEITSTVRVLVPENQAYADLDGDGCNTIVDLQLLAESWPSENPGDPNGDGLINVLDLLYINTSDPFPCTQ